MAAPFLRGFRLGLVTTRLSRAVRSRRFNFQQLSGHRPWPEQQYVRRMGWSTVWVKRPKLHARGDVWERCQNHAMTNETQMAMLEAGRDSNRRGKYFWRRAIHLIIVGGSLTSASVLAGACATFGRKHLDFTTLAAADRIEVRATVPTSTPVATITDRSKVQSAVKFILQRQDRWGDRVNPWVPTLVLQFYSNGQDLGGYGIGRKILVALPSVHGFWWRDVSPAEIDGLLNTLELKMPAR